MWKMVDTKLHDQGKNENYKLLQNSKTGTEIVEDDDKTDYPDYELNKRLSKRA